MWRVMRVLWIVGVLWLSILPRQGSAQEIAFPVDQLNVGLGEPPAQLDRSSPYATMDALLRLSSTNDYRGAAHLLNLASVPVRDQAVRGPLLAEDLRMIIDRQVVIDWNALLDRPDALDANATQDSAVAGQSRKSILLWVLMIDDRPYPIRLDRVQPEDGDPVWVFSQRSVDDIPFLALTFGPSRFERALPDWMRGNAFWSLMWWEVLGLPLALALAAFGGIASYRLLGRFKGASEEDVTHRVILSARVPVAILVTTSALSLLRMLFVFSGPVATVLGPALAIGYFVAVLLLLTNAIDRVIDYIVDFDDGELKQVGMGDRRRMATKVALARRLLVLIIALIGTGVVLAEANIFRTFGFSLLASAGAVTIVLGFAAREVLANIISSMQIALNQSARIGDKVLYQGHLCNVERINFTYVLLRVWTGVRLVVPVTEFVSETFENWTIREPAMQRLIDIRVSHHADVAKLRDLFFEELKELDQDELGDDEDQKVVVTDQNVFGQCVTFCVACANPNTSWAVSCEMRERLIGRMQNMEANGDKIFPDVDPAEGA